MSGAARAGALWAATLAAISCGSDDDGAATGPASVDDARAEPTAEPSADEPEPAPSPLPDDTRQLVVGITETWNARSVELRRYRRGPSGSWRQVGEAWTGVVGRNGVAWGRGLHGDGAPDGRDGPVKEEGDGRAPAGLFEIRGAHGHAAEPPKGQRLAYAPITGETRCVDDPGSDQYNRIVEVDRVDEDWSSAEVMRRGGPLYRWVIVVDHNRAEHRGGAPEPGAGSCIFLHVWSGPDTPTFGCTAMPRNEIEDLLTSLDPEARPVYALLPAPEHRALAERWGLPTP